MALARALTQNGGLSSGTDTLTGVGLGTASADRFIVCLVSPTNVGAVTSASIGGVAATYTGLPALGGEFGTVVANVPTGTSGNVVLTGSGGFQLFGAWAVTGGPQSIPTLINFDVSGTNAFAFNIPANGLVVGIAADFASGATSPSFVSGLVNDTGATVFVANAGATAAIDGSAVSATAQTLTLSSSGAIFPGFIAASFSQTVSALSTVSLMPMMGIG